jgi:hypothetical protein
MFFYEHPEILGYEILNFRSARSLLSTILCTQLGRSSANGGYSWGALAYTAAKIAEYFRCEPKSTILEHGFYVRVS